MSLRNVGPLELSNKETSREFLIVPLPGESVKVFENQNSLKKIFAKKGEKRRKIIQNNDSKTKISQSVGLLRP